MTLYAAGSIIPSDVNLVVGWIVARHLWAVRSISTVIHFYAGVLYLAFLYAILKSRENFE
jgi:hypothetical protein